MVEGSNEIKVISFDLDGTLLNTSGFEDAFWHEVIPRIYSKKHKISLDEAKKLTTEAYREVGKERIEHFKPSYWFERFELKIDWKVAAKEVENKIGIFSETKGVLKNLSRRFKLVVVTHSTKESAELKMNKTEIKKFFVKIFSVVDDFNIARRDESIYLTALKELNLKPNEIIHVGNDYKFDYLTPKNVGIRAIFIDRSKNMKGKDIIHNLREIENIL